MRPRKTPSPILRWAVTGTGLLLIVYLAVLGLWPSIIDTLPAGARVVRPAGIDADARRSLSPC